MKLNPSKLQDEVTLTVTAGGLSGAPYTLTIIRVGDEPYVSVNGSGNIPRTKLDGQEMYVWSVGDSDDDFRRDGSDRFGRTRDK